MADRIDLSDVAVIGSLKTGKILWTDDFSASRNSENLWEGSESYYVYQPYLVNNIPNRGGACRHPGFDFLKCDSIEINNESGAIYKVTVQFKGYYNISGGGGNAGDNTKNMDLQISMSTEPILAHPKFAFNENISANEKKAIRNFLDGKWDAVDATTDLYTLYDLSDPNKTFTVTSNDGKAFIDKIANGQQYVTLPQQTLRYSYTADSLPETSLLNDVGKIKAAPAGAPAVSTGYNWIFLGVNSSQFGDGVWQVSEEYMLSGPGGWDEFFYAND